MSPLALLRHLQWTVRGKMATPLEMEGKKGMDFAAYCIIRTRNIHHDESLDSWG